MRKVGSCPSIGKESRKRSPSSDGVDGEKRTRAHGCMTSRVWHEYGQEKLGRIYCHVDPASAMTFNPEFKMVHTKTVLDGDPFCELTFRSTNEEDKKSFGRRLPTLTPSKGEQLKNERTRKYRKTEQRGDRLDGIQDRCGTWTLDHPSWGPTGFPA